MGGNKRRTTVGRGGASASGGGGGGGSSTGGVSGRGVPQGLAARLTGRRRTWQEVCEQDAAAAVTAAAEATTTGHGVLQQTLETQQQQDQDQQQQHRGDATNDAQPAVGASLPTTPTVDNRAVWRAVHDYLTQDDEALLVAVSRLVPCSLAAQLRSEEDTHTQLARIACSRPVPQKVSGAVAVAVFCCITCACSSLCAVSYPHLSLPTNIEC